MDSINRPPAAQVSPVPLQMQSAPLSPGSLASPEPVFLQDESYRNREMINYDLGSANPYARMCLHRLRYVTCLIKDELRRDGLWDDLIRELYVTAWEASLQKMSEGETYRFAGRRIYAFLKAYDYKLYRGAYIKLEKPFAVVFREIDNPDEFIKPRESPARPYFAGSSLEERIMDILRQKPEGIVRWEICMRLQVSVQELDWYLSPLIKKGCVMEIKRENCRGRPRSPLLAIAGAVVPEERMVKAEMIRRIRQACFGEGKSIKQIAREYHHDRRTVRRAIGSSPAPAATKEKRELVPV